MIPIIVPAAAAVYGAAAGAGAAASSSSIPLTIGAVTTVTAVIGAWLSNIFGKKTDTSAEHQASLVAEQEITQRRIADSEARIKDTQQAVEGVADKIADLSQRTASVTPAISQASEQIKQTGRELQVANNDTQESTHSLVSLHNQFQEVLLKMQQESQITTARLQQLEELVYTKNNEIANLTTVVATQGKALETMQAEKQAQEVIIDRYKATFPKLVSQLGFFREQALQAQTTNSPQEHLSKQHS